MAFGTVISIALSCSGLSFGWAALMADGLSKCSLPSASVALSPMGGGADMDLPLCSFTFSEFPSSSSSSPCLVLGRPLPPEPGARITCSNVLLISCCCGFPSVQIFASGSLLTAKSAGFAWAALSSGNFPWRQWCWAGPGGAGCCSCMAP